MEESVHSKESYLLIDSQLNVAAVVTRRCESAILSSDQSSPLMLVLSDICDNTTSLTLHMFTVANQQQETTQPGVDTFKLKKTTECR